MKNIIIIARKSLILLAILCVGSAYAQQRAISYSATNAKFNTNDLEQTPGVVLQEKIISGLEYIIEIDLNTTQDLKSIEQPISLYGVHPTLVANPQAKIDFKSTEGINFLQALDGQTSSSFCFLVHPKTDIGALFLLGEKTGKQVAVPLQSITITDIPQPTIEGPSTICDGDQITLHSNFEFASYSWTLDNQLLVGENDPSIEVSTPGMYRLLGYTAKGCEAASISFPIRKDPVCSSITDFDYTATENDIQFEATDNLKEAEINYFWSFGDGQTSREATPVHQYKYNGTYKVCLRKSVMTTKDRAVDRTCKTVAVSNSKYGALSKKEQAIAREGLEVFPNPNHGEFKLTLEGLSSGESIEMAVYNDAGSKVWNKTDLSTGTGYYEKFSMPELAPGIYFLQVSTSNNNYYKKLMIH